MVQLIELISPTKYNPYILFQYVRQNSVLNYLRLFAKVNGKDVLLDLYTLQIMCLN